MVSNSLSNFAMDSNTASGTPFLVIAMVSLLSWIYRTLSKSFTLV